MSRDNNVNFYFQADSNHFLDGNTSQAGASSLRSETLQDENAEIFAQSETDSPPEAVFNGYVRPDNYGGILCYSRWQDTSNYYLGGAWYNWNGNHSVSLYKEVGGTTSRVGESTLGGPWSNITLSDGTAADARWWPVRVSFWVESGFRVKVEEDADGDGTWTKLGDTVADTADDLNTGGGVGFGSRSDATSGSDGYNVDEIEVQY